MEAWEPPQSKENPNPEYVHPKFMLLGIKKKTCLLQNQKKDKAVLVSTCMRQFRIESVKLNQLQGNIKGAPYIC